jgi:epimerase EvaD
MMTGMKWRPLKIEGAVEFIPPVFPDHRGFFVTPLSESVLREAVGHPLFPVAQASHSRSRRGTTRGVHFTATPPGMAKFVFCTNGSVRDYVVDLRVGSPTFGAFESLVLDARECRSLYLPVGLGHAFTALEDDTRVSYLLSGEYRAENELAVAVSDPEIGLPLPPDLPPLLSERDLAAPTLAEARERGMLPDYAASRALEHALTSPGAGRP